MTTEMRLTDLMKVPLFSSAEAAALLGIEHGRLQTWANQKLIAFHAQEQGPRRLVRRFDGLQLAGIAVMAELIDKHNLDVADASSLAEDMQTNIMYRVFKSDNPKFGDPNEPRREFYLLANGHSQPCFGVDTLVEARDRIEGQPESFIVLNADPIVLRAVDRIKAIIRATIAARANQEKTS